MNTPTLTPPKPKGKPGRPRRQDATEVSPDPALAQNRADEHIEAIYTAPSTPAFNEYDPPAEAKACTDADAELQEQDAPCPAALNEPPYKWEPVNGLNSHTFSPTPKKTAPRRPTAGTDVNILVDGQHVPCRIVSTGISGFIVRVNGRGEIFDNTGHHGKWKIDHPFFK